MVLTSEDRAYLRNFIPGIYDARVVHDRLTDIAERTGALSYNGKRWKLTESGQNALNNERRYISWLATFAHNLRTRGLIFALVFGVETAPKTVPKKPNFRASDFL